MDRMADFDIKLLDHTDGSWQAFRDDWKAQCEEAAEPFDDYAPEALALLERIVSEHSATDTAISQSQVGALWDSDTKHFYAACVLNRALIPAHPGYTLRVRHIIVSPLIDYGVSDIRMYPDVVIGMTLGIVHVSSTVLQANNIHFHLRSPEDVDFFRAFGAALHEAKVFASVQPRGSWLYIEKMGAVGTASTQELT